MRNIRNYKKMIKEAKVGETFYFNAIAGTSAMIEYTKELIQTGKIAPVSEELGAMIKPEAQRPFYEGKSLAPQMTYEIIG